MYYPLFTVRRSGKGWITRFKTSGDMINTFWHLANELQDYVPSEQQKIIMNSISLFVSIDVIPPKDESDPANDFLKNEQ